MCLYIFEKKIKNKKTALTLMLGWSVRAMRWRLHYKRRGSRRTPGNDPSQNSRRLLL